MYTPARFLNARAWTVAVLGAAGLLGGCASTWRVDSQVESFARWTDAGGAAGSVAAAPTALPQAPQSYRFERLPSQGEGQGASRQGSLESLAREVLAPLGWTAVEDNGASRWTVQVSASGSRPVRSPWEDGWPYLWPVWGVGIGSHGPHLSGQLVWGARLPYHEPPYYERRVSLVVREAASGRVVYETRAAHDGRWSDSPELWRAMISAALRDFPAPPSGVREVIVDLPR
jgi:Domain of unknown function (DUF4136)